MTPANIMRRAAARVIKKTHEARAEAAVLLTSTRKIFVSSGRILTVQGLVLQGCRQLNVTYSFAGHSVTFTSIRLGYPIIIAEDSACGKLGK